MVSQPRLSTQFHSCLGWLSLSSPFIRATEEYQMTTYAVLINFTDQGVRNAKDSFKRTEAFKDMAKKCGVTVKDIYWTQGQYDGLTIIDAPDDMTATALTLSMGALGNVRTQTMRAYSSADMKTIIGKLA
jgi:uncharacterized protein with GYD domain